jgi:hypothetical protein
LFCEGNQALTAKSTSMPFTSNIYAPTTTTFSSNISPFASDISLSDHRTSDLDQNGITTTRSALDAITLAINNHMAPKTTLDTQKRKRLVERPYGESLTSVEALVKIQQKENSRKKTQSKPKKTSAKRKSTVEMDTEAPWKKR